MGRAGALGDPVGELSEDERPRLGVLREGLPVRAEDLAARDAPVERDWEAMAGALGERQADWFPRLFAVV
jgi:hypothetical protein